MPAEKPHFQELDQFWSAAQGEIQPTFDSYGFSEQFFPNDPVAAQCIANSVDNVLGYTDFKKASARAETRLELDRLFLNSVGIDINAITNATKSSGIDTQTSQKKVKVTTRDIPDRYRQAVESGNLNLFWRQVARPNGKTDFSASFARDSFYRALCPDDLELAELLEEHHALFLHLGQNYVMGFRQESAVRLYEDALGHADVLKEYGIDVEQLETPVQNPIVIYPDYSQE